jgi:hypothetical protein
MAIADEDAARQAQEATANLRVIRELMERSTKHSTFSGFSGVFAGLISIAGCLYTRSLYPQHLTPGHFHTLFLITWLLVALGAIGADFVLTKRRAARVGKRVLSRLGRQMALASAPGLVTGALLTVVLLRHGLPELIYPIWMLSYGIAVSAVGLFSQREVSILGACFLAAGAAALFLLPAYGLTVMAIAFGGFHVLYGVLISRKDG